MAQQDILDYIRKTPHNSNVNVVKGMLNAEGGGGGASGMVVETVLDESKNVYVSTIPATDVVAAFKSGSNVLVHVPDSNINPEAYVGLINYIPENQEMSIVEAFTCSTEGVGNVTGITINEAGYIEVGIYID